MLSNDFGVEKEYKNYNKKPFNINALIPSSDSRLLANEYRFYVLSLNEYLTTREIDTKQIEIFTLIEDWVFKNHNKKTRKNPLSTLIVNSARELLFVCGFWASQVILSPEQKQKIVEAVNQEINESIKQIQKIEKAVKNISGIDENPDYKNVLTAWNDYLNLTKEYLKYLHTNKGNPSIVYFAIQLKSNEILELTGISKKEIINFLAELFVKFGFVHRRNEIKFSYNLYRNLNRVANIEKIKNLGEIAKRISTYFNQP